MAIARDDIKSKCNGIWAVKSRLLEGVDEPWRHMLTKTRHGFIHIRYEPTSDDVEDTVENLSFGIRFGSSTGFGRWEQRFQEAPWSITQVCWVRFPGCHAGIVPQIDATD